MPLETNSDIALILAFEADEAERRAELEDRGDMRPLPGQWARHRDPVLNRLALLKDALDLVAELWPRPGYRSVTLETHQWVKLRRVLLAIPDLVAGDE